MSKIHPAARKIWYLVPEEARASEPVVRLRREIVRLTNRPAAPPVRVVHTLDEVDEVFAELDQAGTISDDALRRGFSSFRMEIDVHLPEDPFSDGYRDAVLELYEWLHGGPYSIANEDVPFDVEDAIDRPFPYSTASASTVGNQLMAIGHIIRTLDLPARSRVLEFGSGWGNTTLALARMGHHVTALDISPKFAKLVEAQAGRMNTQVETVVGDFSMINEMDGSYDAVLFFECFHHCTRHLDLLAGLDRVVVPGGRVLFAAEPITKGFPVPWGIRLDGESLWAIRRHGWFELGFRRSYFLQALARYGWKADHYNLPQTPWGEIYVATRR